MLGFFICRWYNAAMLTDFFIKNLDIVFFVYGLAFVIMGTAVLLYPRKESIFKLADIIWLLALFALVHGLNEWLDMFDLLRAGNSRLFDSLQLAVLALSYGFLFEFGRRLLRLDFKGFFINGIFAALLYCLVLVCLILLPARDSSVLVRYILGFPGGLLTAFGLFFYYRNNEAALKPSNVRGYFFIAAFAIGFYAFLGGIVVSRADFFPASLINDYSFLGLLGIPVQLLRALCAIFLTWSVWNILGIFDWEALEREKQAAASRAAAEAEHKRAEELERLYGELKNSHLALQQAQQKLVAAEKMQMVGRMASGIAHDVKNPLAIIMQSAEYLKRNLKHKTKDLSLILDDIQEAVMRADNVIKGLLDFAAFSKLELKSQELNQVVENTLLFMKYHFEKHHIRVIRDFGQGLPLVKMDKARIGQILVNIILNAIEAMPGGGELNIRTCLEEGAYQQRRAVVEIKDSGSGMPEENLRKIFEPFFTTRRDVGGTGLGLWITRNIIEMHGGGIEIENRKEGRGLRVAISLIA